jgi:hypothetical protein
LRHSSGVNVKRIILTFGSPPFGRGARPSSGFMQLSLRRLPRKRAHAELASGSILLNPASKTLGNARVWGATGGQLAVSDSIWECAWVAISSWAPCWP